MRSHTLQLRVALLVTTLSNHSQQLERAHTKQQRSSTAKNAKKKKNLKKKIGNVIIYPSLYNNRTV